MLWHYHGESRVYRDVVIQLSDDPDFMKNVRTVYNNDKDNTSGLGKGTDREYAEAAQGQWIPIKAQKARFVRLYSRGNTSDPQNQYIEAEVWATPAKAAQATPRPAAKANTAKPSGKAITKFILPTPQFLDLETMAKQHEAAQRKRMMNLPVELAPAPKTAPPGYEAAKFRLPAFSFLGASAATALKNAQKYANPAPYETRGVVYLPKGSANVALHKPVTASDDTPLIGTPALITDGEKDASESSWVEFGPGTQWVQIDLQSIFDIHGVLLWHYHGEPRVYRDVVIQLADDVDFLKNVRTVYNNDRDNSSGLGPGKEREYYESLQGGWIPIKAQKSRYVRLYSRGNTSDPQNQYIEAEVWATLAK